MFPGDNRRLFTQFLCRQSQVSFTPGTGILVAAEPSRVALIVCGPNGQDVSIGLNINGGMECGSGTQSFARPIKFSFLTEPTLPSQQWFWKSGGTGTITVIEVLEQPEVFNAVP